LIADTWRVFSPYFGAVIVIVCVRGPGAVSVTTTSLVGGWVHPYLNFVTEVVADDRVNVIGSPGPGSGSAATAETSGALVSTTNSHHDVDQPLDRLHGAGSVPVA
jgi:hypothetical protein